MKFHSVQNSNVKWIRRNIFLLELTLLCLRERQTKLNCRFGLQKGTFESYLQPWWKPKTFRSLLFVAKFTKQFHTNCSLTINYNISINLSYFFDNLLFSMNFDLVLTIGEK